MVANKYGWSRVTRVLRKLPETMDNIPFFQNCAPQKLYISFVEWVLSIQMHDYRNL